MKDFFIDFENVHKSGLEGIETLSRFDRVFLFYSDAAESIDIDQIVSCKARIKFVKAVNGQPNALDFQLVGFLFRKLRRGRKYFIISKDKGYTSIMGLAKEYGAMIEMYESIKEAKEDEVKKYTPKEKIKNIIFVSRCEKECDEYGIDKAAALEISQEIEQKMGIPPSSEYLRLVIDGLKSSNEKAEFYTFCIYKMGREQGQQLYTCLKKNYAKMKQIVELAS
ncbi:PIN domain-containing protein [Butyrivibrio sp. XPD2006]|uniref:PIN domain-containing protein n=1 Tax=Butyrivibrio sp. XPD2006 TaxID=1280668 RepID=UPI0003B319FD|nr:PIN domain-containing protein [Butyrivibrio sp. XPD2006]